MHYINRTCCFQQVLFPFGYLDKCGIMFIVIDSKKQVIPMKKRLLIFILCLLLTGCSGASETADIAATTLPVWEFTTRLCEGTGLTVTRLVTESVSCLHDYSLNVRQVRAAEAADVIIINGAGLEEFMEDLLVSRNVIDSSEGIEILECSQEHDHEHDHDHGHEGHSHDADSHIWLSVENAKVMAKNICAGLSRQYPKHVDIFAANLEVLIADLDELDQYADHQLADLSCREIITFHDGFGYLAESFDLHILETVEEESGAEASAAELKEMIEILRHHDLPAIFTEINGSVSAANIIAAETGTKVYPLDMAMAGNSWFDAMYRNIDTLKEALG